MANNSIALRVPLTEGFNGVREHLYDRVSSHVKDLSLSIALPNMWCFEQHHTFVYNCVCVLIDIMVVCIIQWDL